MSNSWEDTFNSGDNAVKNAETNREIWETVDQELLTAKTGPEQRGNTTGTFPSYLEFTNPFEEVSQEGQSPLGALAETYGLRLDGQNQSTTDRLGISPAEVGLIHDFLAEFRRIGETRGSDTSPADSRRFSQMKDRQLEPLLKHAFEKVFQAQGEPGVKILIDQLNRTLGNNPNEMRLEYTPANARNPAGVGFIVNRRQRIDIPIDSSSRRP